MKSEPLTPTEAVKRLELSDKVEGIMKEKNVSTDLAVAGLFVRGEITEKKYQTYRDLTFVESNLPLFQYVTQEEKKEKISWNIGLEEYFLNSKRAHEESNPD
jgi:hypothetical protein